MKKWLLRILYAALVLLPIGAIADYTATPGSGSTVFAFVCFTTKICPAHVLTNSAGTEIATSGNPVRTDPTGTTTQPVAVASGIPPYAYTPLSPMQASLSITSATALTVPSTSTYAVVCAVGQTVNYTTDGTTTPTSSAGMPLAVGQCVSLSGPTVLANFKAIQTAATATLNVSYFK